MCLSLSMLLLVIVLLLTCIPQKLPQLNKNGSYSIEVSCVICFTLSDDAFCCRDSPVIDTPCLLHSRMCRFVSVSNVTVTHSYIAPASSAFTAHSGATLIKDNRRFHAAQPPLLAWPALLSLSKYPGSARRSVPALWLAGTVPLHMAMG